MIHAPIFPQGTRIRVQRGSLPMDADLLGREGVVVELSDYEPGRYGVVLDGEEEVREFAEDELEKLAEPAALEERDDTGPTVGP